MIGQEYTIIIESLFWCRFNRWILSIGATTYDNLEQLKSQCFGQFQNKRLRICANVGGQWPKEEERGPKKSDR